MKAYILTRLPPDHHRRARLAEGGSPRGVGTRSTLRNLLWLAYKVNECQGGRRGLETLVNQSRYDYAGTTHIMALRRPTVHPESFHRTTHVAKCQTRHNTSSHRPAQGSSLQSHSHEHIISPPTHTRPLPTLLPPSLLPIIITPSLLRCNTPSLLLPHHSLALPPNSPSANIPPLFTHSTNHSSSKSPSSLHATTNIFALV